MERYCGFYVREEKKDSANEDSVDKMLAGSMDDKIKAVKRIIRTVLNEDKPEP